MQNVKKAQRKPYEATLSVDATMADGMVTIVIKDNGIGIEDKIIDKIFDPFFTTKTTGEASGIGLYLSHDVIQNYGGNISVESVKDEYTQFTKRSWHLWESSVPALPTRSRIR